MKRRIGVAIVVAGLVASSAEYTHITAAGGAIEGTVRAGGAAMADAVVYVQQAPGTFTPPGPANMDQKSMKFSPHVLPVLVGTTVKFLNSDPTQHNVFSPDNEKYNLGTWPQGQTKDHVFAKCAKAPCVYVQLCRIHPEMEAYIVVLQNPFFAVTDGSGKYRISGVPPGSYSVGVWANKGKAPAKPITVDVAKPITVDFTLAK